MIPTFCNWLSNTAFSMVIQDKFWIIPAVQTVHILAIATVMASIVMVDFRLLGVLGRGESLPDVAHRFLPWVWGAVVVLACSGSLLIVGEPGRELMSEVFWTKMSLLACALAVTGTFHYVLNRREEFWERRRLLGRATAVVSLLLFVAIVAAGRWIAYMAHG
ncbi:MAG: DUF6644 family protein [Steroidobacteraceae bacterium]